MMSVYFMTKIYVEAKDAKWRQQFREHKMIMQDSKWNTILTGIPQIQNYTSDSFPSDYARQNFNQQWLTLDKNQTTNEDSIAVAAAIPRTPS